MFRVVYTSSAVTPFSEQELDELLETSRRNNLAANITGMLLYKDGDFMQVLEGPSRDVRALTEKIKKDPRHHKFTSLIETMILDRSFGRWSMGFKRIGPEPLGGVPDYHESDSFTLLSDRFLKSPVLSLDLLLYYAQSV